jgi:hypothetical protein
MSGRLRVKPGGTAEVETFVPAVVGTRVFLLFVIKARIIVRRGNHASKGRQDISGQAKTV